MTTIMMITLAMLVVVGAMTITVLADNNRRLTSTIAKCHEELGRLECKKLALEFENRGLTAKLERTP